MTENSSAQIHSLDEHRQLILDVFSNAQNQILIMSPFISIDAINFDNILPLVRQATDRGVNVRIFVDSVSNCYENGDMKSRALDGIAEMVSSGAQVAIVNGLPCSFIARDNDLAAVGSFNWLSAIRIRNGEIELKNPSLIHQGELAADKIDIELTKIEETDHAFATILKNSGFEITIIGKIAGLISVLVLPTLIANDLGNSNMGILCSIAIVLVSVLYCWMNVIKSGSRYPTTN